MTAQILEFPVIPRKPTDRGGQLYRCTDCGDQRTWPWRVDHAVYCDNYACGAEMRPVEAK